MSKKYVIYEVNVSEIKYNETEDIYYWLSDREEGKDNVMLRESYERESFDNEEEARWAFSNYETYIIDYQVNNGRSFDYFEFVLEKEEYDEAGELEGSEIIEIAPFDVVTKERILEQIRKEKIEELQEEYNEKLSEIEEDIERTNRLFPFSI